MQQVREFARILFGNQRFYIDDASCLGTSQYSTAYLALIGRFDGQHTPILHYRFTDIIQVVQRIVLGEGTGETLVDFSLECSYLGTYLVELLGGIGLDFAKLIQDTINSPYDFFCIGNIFREGSQSRVVVQKLLEKQQMCIDRQAQSTYFGKRMWF